MNRRSSRTLFGLAFVAAVAGVSPARAQQADSMRMLTDTIKKADSTRATETLRTASTTSKADSAATAPRAKTLGDYGTSSEPVRLSADLSSRELTVVAGNGSIRTFKVAIGTAAKPTPTGTFSIRKIVWNPSWIPPDEKWAKGKTAKGPGEAGNPMKVAKIFFREPDYYIHGTAAVNSLGTADSHGCLRMSPDEIAELAKFLMENGGQAKEEGWFSRVAHMRWKTHTVMLSQPVTLTISQ